MNYKKLLYCRTIVLLDFSVFLVTIPNCNQACYLFVEMQYKLNEMCFVCYIDIVDQNKVFCNA